MSYTPWAETDELPWETVNANFDEGGVFVFGHRSEADSGLTVGYHGGPFDANTVADGTVAGLTDNTTNYLVVNRSTRAVTSSTATTNWNNTATYGRMARAVFASGVLTWHDERFSAGGIFDHGATAVGDVIGPGSATDNDIARFDGTTGKLIKSGLSYDTDTTLAANSNTRVPTQAAVKAYVDTAVAGVVSNVPAQRYAIELANTSDTDPGAGLIKFNNATPTSATELYVDDSTTDSVDLSTYFSSLGATGFVKIQSALDAGEWAIFKWTALTDRTGWWRFTVTLQASKGTLDDADAVLVEFDSDANTGSGGTELKGLTFTSDTGSTADSDPGAGLMKWNNATQGSATKLFFDNTTLDSITITSFFATLSTDGTVYMQQADDSTKWQLWEIDSATADSGYYDMAVTLLAKSSADIVDDKTVFCDFKKGGVTGGGSKFVAWLSPMDSQPPTSNYASLDVRNDIAVLVFDASADEAAFWTRALPSQAALGSGLKFSFYWMGATATSGTTRWGVQVWRANTDMDSDSYDTAATAGGTANGTSGVTTQTDITQTNLDGAAAGELVLFKVYRDADGTSGTDDMTGDAQLIGVLVETVA